MFDNYKSCEQETNLRALLPSKECFHFKVLVIYSNITKVYFLMNYNQINLTVSTCHYKNITYS